MQISALNIVALAGEVEYPEFIEIMTSTLAKLAHKKEEEGEAGNQVCVTCAGQTERVPVQQPKPCHSLDWCMRRH
jgi:hypothetical protein